MTLQEKKRLVKAANFSQENILKLYKRFCQLDSNNNGKLDLKEILNIPDMNENPLVNRLLDVFDTNSDGGISFSELLVGLAKLAENVDEIEKTKFAFDVYDVNKDGIISNGDLFASLQIMVGNNLSTVQIQQLVDRTILQVDKNGDGMISFDEFREFTLNMDIKSRFKFNL